MAPGTVDAAPGRSWRRRATPLAAAALLLALAAQLLVEAWGDSLTFDETRYIRTGACARSTRTIDLEVSNPPAHKLLAGAGLHLTGQHPSGSCADSDAFFPRDPGRLRRWILAARLGAVAVGLALAATVFLWSRALHGALGGLLSLAVAAVEPALLGHEHLATGDAPAALAMTACLAAHWRWSRCRQRRWLVVSGLALGLGLLSKPPAMLPVVPTLVLAGPLLAASPWRPRPAMSPPGGGTLRRRLAGAAAPASAVVATGWALVCLVYLPFRQTHGGWGAPLSWLAPPSWLATVSDELSTGPGHVGYLNGTVRPGTHPFPQYFLEALGLKTTLGLLVLAAVAAVLALRRRDLGAGLHLWLPIALLVSAATAGATDVGVRYVLPVYPLLAVATGAVLTGPVRRRGFRAAVASLALAATAASSLAHAPLHLGYVNELAGDRPERLLSDSNLDWGQDAWRLRDWWESRGRPPLSLAYFGTLGLDHYGIRGTDVHPGREVVHGLLAVSITRLTVTGDDTQFPYAGRPYAALQRLVPVDRVGTSILVYQLR